MKKLVLFLSLFTIAPTSSPRSLTAQDAHHILCGANPQDAQILLNVIYWSYFRSATTIAIQEILFDQVQHSWMLWLNSATTRRNPRTALPYPEVIEIDPNYANFAAQTQALVNATYLKVLENSIEQNSLLVSPAIKKYIEQARTEVRNRLAHTIINAIVDLEKTFQSLHNIIESVHSKKFIRDMHEMLKQREADKNFITDGIDYLMNGLALQSFAQFDKKYLANSDQFFKMLAETQTMYSAVWQQLETSRAAYYQELYSTVYATMVELNFPSISFLHAFDENGFIFPDNQTTPLPALLL